MSILANEKRTNTFLMAHDVTTRVDSDLSAHGWTSVTARHLPSGASLSMDRADYPEVSLRDAGLQVLGRMAEWVGRMIQCDDCGHWGDDAGLFESDGAGGIYPERLEGQWSTLVGSDGRHVTWCMYCDTDNRERQEAYEAYLREDG